MQTSPVQVADRWHLIHNLSDAVTGHRRYADAEDPQQLIGPRGTGRDSILDAFKPYLLHRCAEQVTGTNLLLAEIRQRGYTGGERTLRRWLISVHGSNAVTPSPPKTRDIVGWIMRPTGQLSQDETAELEQQCGLCPDLAVIRDLARGFAVHGVVEHVPPVLGARHRRRFSRRNPGVLVRHAHFQRPLAIAMPDDP
ncbi:hypothetical protein [Dactylosporangium sp. NPDC051484]|uniref:hypothetical protein n=1 Tax=Dactylosporangium sp. NPDC051484 TaxID=3154942 RepID=UPI0034505D9A